MSCVYEGSSCEGGFKSNDFDLKEGMRVSFCIEPSSHEEWERKKKEEKIEEAKQKNREILDARIQRYLEINPNFLEDGSYKPHELDGIHESPEPHVAERTKQNKGKIKIENEAKKQTEIKIKNEDETKKEKEERTEGLKDWEIVLVTLAVVFAILLISGDVWKFVGMRRQIKDLIQLTEIHQICSRFARI